MSPGRSIAMEKFLFWVGWIIFFYITITLVLRFLSKLFKQYHQGRALNLIIITLNSQQRIEWMIMSYQFWNERRSPKGNITCLDLGSTDDTLEILHRLNHKYPDLKIVSLGAQEDIDQTIQNWLGDQQINKDKMIVLDLREVGTQKYREKVLM